MIFDAVETAYTVVLANFATDMAALIAAKGVTGVVSAATVVKRQNAETYLALGTAPPAIGIWARGTTTQAKVGTGWRDNASIVVLDYYCTDSNPVDAAKQAELAAEALLKSIDKMPGAGNVVFGAGELRGSVTVEMSDGYLKDAGEIWYRRAQVTFPLTDRDEPV